MSSGLPTASIAGTSGAPAATTEVPPITSGPAASVNSAPVLNPALVLSPAEMSTAIRDLTLTVLNLRTFLQGPYAPPPPAGAFAPSSPATTSHQGIPTTQIRFPPSPSQLLAWLDAPVFTTAPAQPTVLNRPRHLRPPPSGVSPGTLTLTPGVPWCRTTRPPLIRLKRIYNF
jgi:hypothetical protein